MQKKTFHHSIKCRPENEIILSKLKEYLQDAIDYEKSTNTNSISNDSQINQLISELLNINSKSLIKKINTLSFVKEHLPKTKFFEKHGWMFDEKRYDSLEYWELIALKDNIEYELGIYFKDAFT